MHPSAKTDVVQQHHVHIPPDSLSEGVSARAGATTTSNNLVCTCSALNSTKHHDSGYTPFSPKSHPLEAHSLGKHGRHDVKPPSCARIIGGWK